MNWKFLICGSFKPNLKFALSAEAASAAGDVLSFGFGLVSDAYNHDLQMERNRQQQQWQEDMYNKYQSPEALMRQYKSAGLNPFLLGENVGTGSVPSTSAGGSVSGHMPDFSGHLAAMQQADSAKMLSAASSGNQRAQTITNFVSAVTEACIKLGPSGARDVFTHLAPELQSLGLDYETAYKLVAPQIRMAEANADISEFESYMAKKYGEEKTLLFIEKTNQDIVESVGRLGLMSAQSDEIRENIKLIRAQTRSVASVIARNYAEAFKLRKEGEKYEVDTQTAKQIQKYVVGMYKDNAQMLYHASENEAAVFASEQYYRDFLESEDARQMKLEGAHYDLNERSSYIHRAIKMTLEDLGNLFHVSGGFNWSNFEGNTHSYGEFNNVTPRGEYKRVVGF